MPDNDTIIDQQSTATQEEKNCCLSQFFVKFCSCGNSDIPHKTTAPSPYLLILAALTILAMGTQIKLPLGGGFLSLADVLFGITFLWAWLASWKHKDRLHFPLPVLLFLLVTAASTMVTRPGKGGAMELIQLYEMLFCGGLLGGWLIRRAPRLLAWTLTGALLLNLLVIIRQSALYGFGSVLPPADILALKWGFGHACTGLFRSRMAVSFFFALAIPLLLPSWFGGDKPELLRLPLVFLLLVVLLLGIPHGLMLTLAILGCLFAAALLGRRPLLVTILAAAVSIAVSLGLPGNRQTTCLTTLTLLKSDSSHAGELKTCHLDCIAAFRLAATKPLTGIGPGNYQKAIGQFYRELPNPSYNDIDTDTQAAWGIIAVNYGLPAATLLLMILLGGTAFAVRRLPPPAPADKALRTPMSTTELFRCGAAATLPVLAFGMLFSDPLTRGLGWLVALALASAFALRDEHGRGCPLGNLQAVGVLITGLLLGVLAVPALLLPPKFQGTDNNQAAPSPTLVKPSQAQDIFLLLNPSQVKEITPPFEKYSDSLAAEKQALRIPDGKGTPPDGEEPDMKYGGATYTFELPADSECLIWLRVWWDGSCGNTVALKIDDEEKAVTVGNDSEYKTWHWYPSPRTYSLKAGTHTLQVLNREDGIALDQILVTNDGEYHPDGIEEINE
jgi:hypothetical protein